MLTNLVDKKVINRPSYETIQTMTQRINWIDWAKVFAIYLVILGHHISKDVEGESLVKNFIYAFHMPFFFFISGLFI